MGKTLKGLVLIVCGVAALICAKIFDMPTVITFIVVLIALGLFIFGLAIGFSPSPSDKES